MIVVRKILKSHIMIVTILIYYIQNVTRVLYACIHCCSLNVGYNSNVIIVADSFNITTLQKRNCHYHSLFIIADSDV